MKNLQNGFAIPLLISIIALLLLGGGTYVYLNQSTKTEMVDDINNNNFITTSDFPIPVQMTATSTLKTAPSNTTANTTASSQQKSSSLQTYSNSTLGFELKYPSDWSTGSEAGMFDNIGYNLNLSFCPTSTFSPNQNGKGGNCAYTQSSPQSGMSLAPILLVAFENDLVSVAPAANSNTTTIKGHSYTYRITLKDPAYRDVYTQIIASLKLISATPAISTVTSPGNPNFEFHSGDKVTITGFNFPVDAAGSTIVLIGNTRVTDVTGLLSVDYSHIDFTVPSIDPGTYTLSVTGVVGRQAANPYIPGQSVQSNTVQVKILSKANATIDWRTSVAKATSFIRPANWQVKDDTFTLDNVSYPLFHVISPDRTDLPGYSGKPVHYLLQISIDPTSNKITSIGDFQETGVMNGQSPWNTNIDSATKVNTDEYKVAQQIINSVKYVPY